MPPDLRRVLRETRIPTPDPGAVVRIGAEEKGDVDLGPTWDQVVRLYASGLHPAIGLTVRHRGRVILDRTVGHVEHRPGAEPGAIATPDTLFNLFSASKIVSAFLLLCLVEDGLVSLDRPAADYLPAFARHGKERITVRHLLNHTAGIPDMPRDLDFGAVVSAGRLPLEPLYDLRPLTPAGKKVAYHPVTSWALLDAIINAVTGSDLRQLARTRLLDPQGFKGMTYGVAPQDMPLVAKHLLTGPPTVPVMARVFERTIGTDLATAVALSNDPAFLTAVLPSANVIGTGAETVRFLQLLLNGGQLDGQRILSEALTRKMYTELTPSALDRTFGLPMRYGLGVMMGEPRVSLYGPGTAEAFGHLGFSTVVVYADPARDLCVSFLNSGKPMLAPGMLRWLWILQRIAILVPPK